MRRKAPGVLLLIGLLLAACGRGSGPLPLPSPTARPGEGTPAGQAPPSSTPSPAPTLTASPTVSPSPTPSPTADPFAGLTIDDLSVRLPAEGEVQALEVLAENGLFTRYLISYPSDGLAIYGFMNLPKGEGPFPVIVAVHGYVDPWRYETLDYTTRYADALASASYLVLHPNLRGYPPSEDGPNRFRIGFAIDVLDLISLVAQTGGQPGALEQADPGRIGLWGHSMGGGISVRVMTVSPEVRAVVLYGAMSGDERLNYERIYYVFSEGARGQEELATPQEDLQRISPIYYLERVKAAVSIHHGEVDQEVPLEWSEDLCERLQGLEKAVECFTYPGQPHTFYGDADTLFIQRNIAFFDRYLKQP